MSERTEPLTDKMIRALRDEAANAGDRELAQECELALDGVEECRWACANAITDARASDDAGPFVRVVA